LLSWTVAKSSHAAVPTLYQTSTLTSLAPCNQVVDPGKFSGIKSVKAASPAVVTSETTPEEATGVQVPTVLAIKAGGMNWQISVRCV
jgi:hypothetical protein